MGRKSKVERTKAALDGGASARGKDSRVVGILRYLGAESPVVEEADQVVPELTYLSPAQQGLRARQAEPGAEAAGLFAPPPAP